MITPYPFTFSGEQAVQEKEEFEDFLGFIREKNIKSYLEIGVARGDTFHEVVSQMPNNSKAVAIDLPDCCWGFSDSIIHIERALNDLSSIGYEIFCRFDDSRNTNSIELARVNAPFDLIFIDGNHSYKGVKADFENYGQMGKFIAFHDIVDCMRSNRKGEKIEVPLFWQELKQEYPHKEFIVDGSNMGIGIIWGHNANS